ncbi:MAG: 30S ribosomal protein S16 [Candidatus Kerfeldbacteria bacterium]|nr:30S ribosomal protein S16 [Candidatus Kerfeldbacteria bacterium]
MFRMVVQEKRRAPQSRIIERLGFLNPHTGEHAIKIDRVQYWMSKGAQPSARVHNLLVDDGLITTPKKRTQLKRPKPAQEKTEATQGTEKPADSTAASTETPKASA